MARAAAAGAVAPWRRACTRLAGPCAARGLRADARHAGAGAPPGAGVPLRLEQAVQRLHRTRQGWRLVLAGGETAGPFDQVVLAMPPAQAAVLLAGHHDRWADALAAVPHGALLDADGRHRRRRLALGRRRARRAARWPGWRATTASPAAQRAARHRHLGGAGHPGVERGAPGSRCRRPWRRACARRCRRCCRRRAGCAALRWHHGSVHRWRYALPAEPRARRPRMLVGRRPAAWACAATILAGGDVEAAWRSGDELADTVAAALEEPVSIAEAA